MNKIALFGGSFCPIHLGHKMVVMWLKEAFNYNAIHVIPTVEHAFNKNLLPFNVRFEMCKIALKDIPYAIVSEIELELPKPNKTADVVNWYLKNNNQPFDLVLGSDVIYDLDKWYDWKTIESSVDKIIVIERPGYTNKYIVEGNNKFLYYDVGLTTISSSKVREELRLNKKINHLVGHEIEKYIIDNGLYR